MRVYYKTRYKLGFIKKKITEFYEYYFFKKHIHKIQILKNKYSHRRCFVIGNGPSLNDMDLNLMKDDFVICANSFFLKFKYLNFVPDFITVEDHLVAKDNYKEFNKLKGIKKIYPIDLRRILKKDEDTFFIELRRAFNNKKMDGNFKFNNFNETFYWGGTVLYMNLQLAQYFGCKEVYLIGVDLSYNIPKDATIKGSVITSNSDDPNHFDSSYFGSGKKWHLPETDRMQASFKNAYLEMKKNGVNLFNATKGGNLQEIPRVNYNDLFND